MLYGGTVIYQLRDLRTIKNDWQHIIFRSTQNHDTAAARAAGSAVITLIDDASAARLWQTFQSP